ncbi:MAG: UDP-N-acetylmuramoyl-L-alanine--D-glutamate ligase [Bacillota bacterium]
MDFYGQRILVIGMARSGVAAAQTLARRGAKVAIYDQKTKDKLTEELKKLESYQIDYFLGIEPAISLNKYDLIVISPGVPLTIPLLHGAVGRKIPIWGELELAFRISKSPIIGVTGTNGKTTTTALIGHILKNAGFKIKVAGNIGIPLIQEVVDADEETFLVVEVSSFQLETIKMFHCRAAILLNITPDHLDRHKTVENYVTIKRRIFENQGPQDFAILNYDDPLVRETAKMVKSKVIFFSKSHKLEQGIYFDAGVIKSSLKGEPEEIIKWDYIQLKGTHNLENSMAAIAAAMSFEVDKNSLRRSLHEFSGVPHRLEPVGIIDDVMYINDSKGTNPDATLKALEAYRDRQIVLIAGGLDKGSSFEGLAEYLTEIKAKVVVFGQTAEKIKNAVEETGSGHCYMVQNLEEAVKTAKKIALVGGVVLLSPACASWDMYNNYEERGEHFKRIVREMMG